MASDGPGKRATPANETTPWGESYNALADAVLKDKAAPPALALAAFLYKRGVERELRDMIAQAVALNESESSAPRRGATKSGDGLRGETDR